MRYFYENIVRWFRPQTPCFCLQTLAFRALPKKRTPENFAPPPPLRFLSVPTNDR